MNENTHLALEESSFSIDYLDQLITDATKWKDFESNDLYRIYSIMGYFSMSLLGDIQEICLIVASKGR